MNYFLASGWLCCCLVLLQLPSVAQEDVAIAGKVTDANGEDLLAGASIVAKGQVVGTTTDKRGNFRLIARAESLPITLVVSSPGYSTEEVTVGGPTNVLIVRLTYQALMMGEALVISASRVEESIMESPVSVEKMDISDIRGAAAPSFYDQLSYFKGIDFSASSLAFKAINPRGFGTNGNARVVQLIDGIDNQSPVFNFSFGNIVGISELDLESVEVIPGAASALYGPNAMNGIILMNSKSPFEYQGLSATIKLGATHLDGVDDEPSLYQHYALRYAQAFNDKFAFKVVGDFLRASDFRGVDYRDQRGVVTPNDEIIDPNNRAGQRTYQGINVFGDPLINLGSVAQTSPELSSVRGLLPSDETGTFSPTGYTEATLLDNTVESGKLGVALHYRVTDNVEALAQYNLGVGSTTYTSSDRFALEDFIFQTGKAELRGNNFFLRTYLTQTTSDSYSADAIASLINVSTTVPAYINTFVGARVQGQSVTQAHTTARGASDALRAQNLANGRFQQLFDSLRTVPINEGGAKFIDRTRMLYYEGMYNFSELTDVVEIIVGGNFRRYLPVSEGTIFGLQDNGEEFVSDEWGGYLQASRALFENKMDLTASIRYDKNENFEGQFSPRISGVYTLLDGHNIRASFQTGFRIPTLQTQFLNLSSAGGRLIGTSNVLRNQYNLVSNSPYLTTSVLRAQGNFRNTGDLASSVALLEPLTLKDLKTEKVNTYEVGYRGVFSKKLFLDAYYYFSGYTDFITGLNFTQTTQLAANGETPTPPFAQGAEPEAIVEQQEDVFSRNFLSSGNAEGRVNTHGFAVGAEYIFLKDFILGANVSYTKLLSQDELTEQGLTPEFNAPEWRYNVKLSNQRLTDSFGFSLFWRWQDTFFWSSAFGQAVIPAYQTLDAQISYRIPEIKSVLKLGGSNVFNERYTTGIGNPRMGAIYYVSFTFDQFSN